MIILYGVLIFLAIVMIYMFIVTACMGTEKLKTAQYFMSSLTYSEEATTKLNLLIDKYEADLLTADLQKTVISFTDKNTSQPAGQIWIANKYYTYGQLHKYGVEQNTNWQCKKPNLKTFNRIIKLEKSLQPNNTQDKEKQNNSDTNVILN